MTDVFLFGTLRHAPLLTAVLGGPAETQPAELPDHAVSAVADATFPMIAREPGAVAMGCVLAGCDADALARLDFYEAIFGYARAPVTLADGRTAQAFLPRPGQATAAGPWSLDGWAADRGALNVLTAQEAMSYRGTRSPEAVAAMVSMMQARAASRLRAARSRHGSGLLNGTVEVLRRDRPYANYFTVEDLVLRHARFDGSMSDPVERGVFVAADAAIVLPYDPRRDRVLLVEQIRMGPLVRGDRARWQLEPVAGRIDPGETPDAAARREAREEAGLTLGALHEVAQVYASPGTTTEFYYIFVGIADLPDAAAGAGGLDAEHEDIRTHPMSFDALMTLVGDQRAANAPLVTVAYWLAHHRERLRSGQGAATP